MQREFLKNLGIEDKEIINKILDENSADIGKAKGDTAELENKIKKLETDLSKKTTEYDDLKESTKDYGELTTKIQKLDSDNAQLVADKKQLEIDLNSKVSDILKTHAIENSVRDAKAKNTKAVMALLDMEKITYENNELSGISEQLEALQSGEDTSFLFGADVQPPSGTKLNNPPSNGGNPPTSTTFAEAIAKAINKN